MNMEKLILFFALFFCEFSAQRSWISWLHARHVSQVQKAYGTHIDTSVKAKVPAMGGVVFLLIGSGHLISATLKADAASALFWAYPLLCGAVGLTDDLLKFREHSSEGLNSSQKFALQTATALVWFTALALRGRAPALWGRWEIGVWVWPAAFFFAVGIQNAVNVTDGLDGLAAGGCVVSFAVLAFLGSDVCSGATAGAALSAAFLWHNCHPAKVFMGDSGAHFLAGLMVSCAFTGKGVLALVPAAAGFGVEMLSVVIQLVAIHSFGRKVFLMSPIHHHFQLLGWTEENIVVRFWLIHGLLAALLAAAGTVVARQF